MRILTEFRLLPLAIASLILCSCMPTFAGEEAAKIEATCAGERCQSIAELTQLLGFAPAQPTFIPDRFYLFSQSATADVQAADSTPGRPTAAIMEYRLLGSPHIPAFHVIETVVRDADEVHLTLGGSQCGSEVKRKGRTYIQGTGEGGAYTDGYLSAWRVCVQLGPERLAADSVYFTEGNLIVELKAFPESGVSEDTLLKVADSIRFE